MNSSEHFPIERKRLNVNQNDDSISCQTRLRGLVRWLFTLWFPHAFCTVFEKSSLRSALSDFVGNTVMERSRSV